jgi:hypothetical protein
MDGMGTGPLAAVGGGDERCDIILCEAELDVRAGPLAAVDGRDEREPAPRVAGLV